MSKKNKRVMEKLIDQCRQAYDAKKPLIFIDTEDIDLMDRLAKDSKLVDFYADAERAYKVGELEERKYVKYKKYIGYLPDVLDRCRRFTYQAANLEELSQNGGNPSYGGGTMMAVVHVIKRDTNTINYLRSYVHSYVRCLDNGSALRNSCVLLYGDLEGLPQDLLRYTEVLSVAYPNQAELKEILIQIIEENQAEPLEEEAANEVTELMVGFSLTQAEEYIRRLLWISGENGRSILYSEKREEVLLDAKAQAIRSTGGLLTLYRESGEKKNKTGAGTENELGGMGKYKIWANEAGEHMADNSGYALKRGVPAMKGVLLCGVPGCGKSEAAKILHRKWGLPLLRLDVDQLMGGLVGDSERNMRQALALAEAMAPCILWIDEIDKGFDGAGANQGDGGTFKRMFGRLLTWMQENKKPCFIFATANNISRLPPEFFRSGRFDALFSVFMPTNDECKEIFAEHMRRADKRRKDTAKNQGRSRVPDALFEAKCFEDAGLQSIMDLLTQGRDPAQGTAVKFLTGADIEKIVSLALKKIPQEKMEAPIDITTWKQVVKEIIDDPSVTTLGSSYSGLDKIAGSYVRLLRENFVPVSLEKQLLFQKKFYCCEFDNGNIKVNYIGNCTLNNAYDRALFRALKERIERIASRIETNELAHICL